VSEQRIVTGSLPGELFISSVSRNLVILRRRFYKTTGEHSHCEYHSVYLNIEEARTVMSKDHRTVEYLRTKLFTPMMLGRALYDAWGITNTEWEVLSPQHKLVFSNTAIKFAKSIGIKVQESEIDGTEVGQASSQGS